MSTARMATALAAGQVVFDRALLDADGRAAIHTAKERERPTFARLPAAVFDRTSKYADLPDAWVGAHTARRGAGRSRHMGTLVTGLPAAPGPSPAVHLPREGDPAVRRNALAAPSVVGLLGAALPLALADAESRGTVTTLAAVGAGPGRLRRPGAAQALVVAGLGRAIGLAAGFALGPAARPATGSLQTLVPWTDLTLLVGGVLSLALAVGTAGAGRRPVLPRRPD